MVIAVGAQTVNAQTAISYSNNGALITDGGRASLTGALAAGGTLYVVVLFQHDTDIDVLNMRTEGVGVTTAGTWTRISPASSDKTVSVWRGTGITASGGETRAEFDTSAPFRGAVVGIWRATGFSSGYLAEKKWAQTEGPGPIVRAKAGQIVLAIGRFRSGYLNWPNNAPTLPNAAAWWAYYNGFGDVARAVPAGAETDYQISYRDDNLSTRIATVVIGGAPGPWISASYQPLATKWYDQSLVAAANHVWWDGAVYQMAVLLGWWDGAGIQPVEAIGQWNGVAIDPIESA